MIEYNITPIDNPRFTLGIGQLTAAQFCSQTCKHECFLEHVHHQPDVQKVLPHEITAFFFCVVSLQSAPSGLQMNLFRLRTERCQMARPPPPQTGRFLVSTLQI